MQGIESISDRFSILKNNGVYLGMSLVHGSKVFIAVSRLYCMAYYIFIVYSITHAYLIYRVIVI